MGGYDTYFTVLPSLIPIYALGAMVLEKMTLGLLFLHTAIISTAVWIIVKVVTS